MCLQAGTAGDHSSRLNALSMCSVSHALKLEYVRSRRRNCWMNTNSATCTENRYTQNVWHLEENYSHEHVSVRPLIFFAKLKKAISFKIRLFYANFGDFRLSWRTVDCLMYASERKTTCDSCESRDRSQEQIAPNLLRWLFGITNCVEIILFDVGMD